MHALFDARADEKDNKHMEGCVDAGRAFLAIVFTTFGGIGPQRARDYLDGFFARAYREERAAGGTGSDTNHQRLLFYQRLQAALVRITSDMVEHIANIPRA